MKKKPKITVKVINQGFQKDIQYTFDFTPTAQANMPLDVSTEGWVRQYLWTQPPNMSLEDGESFLREWKSGNVYYSDKNKRRWYKSKVKKHLLLQMKDNLQAIDLLRRHKLL